MSPLSSHWSTVECFKGPHLMQFKKHYIIEGRPKLSVLNGNAYFMKNLSRFLNPYVILVMTWKSPQQHISRPGQFCLISVPNLRTNVSESNWMEKQFPDEMCQTRIPSIQNTNMGECDIPRVSCMLSWRIAGISCVSLSGSSSTSILK